MNANARMSLCNEAVVYLREMRERQREKERGGGGEVGRARQWETNRICIPNICIYSLCVKVLHQTNAFLELVDAN